MKGIKNTKELTPEQKKSPLFRDFKDYLEDLSEIKGFYWTKIDILEDVERALYFHNIYIMPYPVFEVGESKDKIIQPLAGTKHIGWSFNIRFWNSENVLQDTPICNPGEGILGEIFKDRYDCFIAAFRFILDNYKFFDDKY